MSEILRCRSRKRRKNHMVLVVNLPDKRVAEELKKEIQKVIRKQNHLLKEGISFDMYINSVSSAKRYS